jgi:RNA polymerase sigma-70 factor (ECF subfamily)
MAGVGARLLGELLDRHGAALELYARQWCRGPADAVQEALVQLARLPEAPPEVVPWLYRAVRHKAISAGRSERRRARHEAAAARDAECWFVAAADSALDVDAATQALERLELRVREVVVAHLWGGLTFAQIAAIRGGSSSAVHRRYQAGLAALQQELGRSCETKTTRPTG